MFNVKPNAKAVAHLRDSRRQVKRRQVQSFNKICQSHQHRVASSSSSSSSVLASNVESAPTEQQLDTCSAELVDATATCRNRQDSSQQQQHQRPVLTTISVDESSSSYRLELDAMPKSASEPQGATGKPLQDQNSPTSLAARYKLRDLSYSDDGVR